MIKEKIYPSYTDRYFYANGNEYILLKRWNGIEYNYSNFIEFDNPEEAKQYFEGI
jgi:hypothetical protein